MAVLIKRYENDFLCYSGKNTKFSLKVTQIYLVSYHFKYPSIASYKVIGGSRGGVRDARPPWASKFFRFHAVFGKIWRVHAPPGGFTPPPRENPGSATESVCLIILNCQREQEKPSLHTS